MIMESNFHQQVFRIGSNINTAASTLTKHMSKNSRLTFLPKTTHGGMLHSIAQGL